MTDVTRPQAQTNVVSCASKALWRIDYLRQGWIMKFSWFGVEQKSVEALATDLIRRHGSNAYELALCESEAAFAAEHVKESKALWLAARAIFASRNPAVAEPDHPMTDWLVVVRDPFTLRALSIPHGSETKAFSDAAKLWRQGLLLQRIENPKGESVSLVRFWAWLSANGDKLYA